MYQNKMEQARPEPGNAKLLALFPALSWISSSTSKTLRADFWAGLTGAIIVFPQGVAYAMIAGLPPEYGLYTAIIPAILAAMFGSSNHLISGPTAALSVIVFTTVSQFAEAGTPLYIQLCFTLTFCAGLVQLIFGLLKFGAVVNFVSHSVVAGFTAGAAIIIAVSQLKHVMGLEFASEQTAVGIMGQLTMYATQTNSNELLVGVSTMLLCILVKHVAPKAPHMLLAMLAAMVIAYFMNTTGLHINLVGDLDNRFLQLSSPFQGMTHIEPLMGGILAVAMLGLVEAVSISRAISLSSRQNLDSNQEFIGQGVSNVVGSFFSCYVSSGSFTRSGVNYSSGAKTPMAAVFAALILLVIMVSCIEYAAFIPISGIGGLLLVVAWNLIDVQYVKALLEQDLNEAFIFIITCLTAIFFHLSWAVYIGVVVSLFFYLRRTSKPEVEQLSNHLFNIDESQDLAVIRINGSIYFGCVQHLNQTLQSIDAKRVIILGRGINFIDHFGVQMLDDYISYSNREVYFCRFKYQAKKALIDGSVHVNEERFFDRLTPLLKLILKG